MENNYSQCEWCAAFFTPPEYHRYPSTACDNCCIEIWGAALGDWRRQWEELSWDEQLETLKEFEPEFLKAALQKAFHGLEHKGNS